MIGGGVQLENIVYSSLSLFPGCSSEELLLGRCLWLTLAPETMETNEHLVPETNTSYARAFFLSNVATAIESVVAAVWQHHAALTAIVLLEIDTTPFSVFLVLFKTALAISVSLTSLLLCYTTVVSTTINPSGFH